MREILFKAKRIDNGEWVYGNYAFCDCYTKQKHYIFQNKPLEYAVDENTICQYTGLTDKNGNKIWENDIVEGLFYHGLKVKAVVAFKYGAFGLKWNRGDVEEFSAFTSICNVEYEIIGNIFDNPELLEGGAE